MLFKTGLLVVYVGGEYLLRGLPANSDSAQIGLPGGQIRWENSYEHTMDLLIVVHLFYVYFLPLSCLGLWWNVPEISWGIMYDLALTYLWVCLECVFLGLWLYECYKF